jgi:hypothetical protein
MNFARRGTSQPVYIDSIFLAGPNTSDWYILANQNNYKNPFGNFTMQAGDSIWVDIVFKPNLNEPFPAKYADRHADLIARDHLNGADQIIQFRGHVLYAKPVIIPDPTVPDTLDFGFVELHTPTIRHFRLCDSGTAPLLVTTIAPITPPIIAIDGILLGDTIQPGQCVDLTITEVLDTYLDTVVDLNFTFATNCTGSKFVMTHITSIRSGVAQKNQHTPLLNIYPNPVKGNTIILNLPPDAKITKMSIYDVLGKEMYKQKILQQTSDQLEIPIGNLLNGIYYARLIIDGKAITQKFEIIR